MAGACHAGDTSRNGIGNAIQIGSGAILPVDLPMGKGDAYRPGGGGQNGLPEANRGLWTRSSKNRMPTGRLHSLTMIVYCYEADGNRVPSKPAPRLGKRRAGLLSARHLTSVQSTALNRVTDARKNS